MTFDVNAQGGFLLTVTGYTQTFTLSPPTTFVSGDTLATFHLPQAGTYNVDLVFFQELGRRRGRAGRRAGDQDRV